MSYEWQINSKGPISSWRDIALFAVSSNRKKRNTTTFWDVPRLNCQWLSQLFNSQKTIEMLYIVLYEKATYLVNWKQRLYLSFASNIEKVPNTIESDIVQLIFHLTRKRSNIFKLAKYGYRSYAVTYYRWKTSQRCNTCNVHRPYPLVFFSFQKVKCEVKCEGQSEDQFSFSFLQCRLKKNKASLSNGLITYV